MTSAARYEYKEGPGMPVVFRAKQYSSASDALSSYINDFEGQEARRNSAKYEKELMTLFCPQYQPTPPRAGNASMGPARQGKSKREQELEKLVQQAYDQLRRLKESKKIEDTMNASSRLLDKLDRDRLPSPTRSAILAPPPNPTGRQSMESVATEVLLDAKPLDFSAPYAQQPQSHANKSLLESLDLNGGMANGGMGTMPNGFGAVSNGPYQLRGMNELMGSLGGASDKATAARLMGTGGGLSLSSDSLTVNDLLSGSGLNASRRSADSTLRKEDLLTTSQLGDIRQRLASEYPFTAGSQGNALNGTMRDNERSSRLASNGVTQSQNGVDSLLNNSSNRRDRSRDSAKMNKSKSDSRSNSFQQSKPNQSDALNHKQAPTALPAYLMDGYNIQGHMNGVQGQMNGSVTSGATDHSSSIISGHLLKGKRQRGAAKVVSTPKRNSHKTDSKQLRFDLDNSKFGHSLPDARDLSAHSKSLDLSNIDRISVEKPDFSFGRKAVVSILKPQSPMGPKKRGPSSRVSFTTDDLIQADASGLATHTDRRPRSKSLPRRASRDHGDQERSLWLGDESSLMSHRGRSRVSPLRGASRARTVEGYGSAVDPASVYMKQGRYKQFLEGLMREIEDSSSSILTQAAAPPSLQPKMATPNSSFGARPPPDEGPGFLARVKELLTSPPSISQYMNGSTGAEHNDSLSTDAVLDGDRSWERILPFKAPTAVTEEEKKEKTRFEKFMEECMAEANGTDKTLTGSSQPGALETLKNMMFKMQSFSEPQAHQEQDDTLEESVHLPLDDSVDKLLSPETKRLLSKSYSTQPGGACLSKAMEHLTKLKDLVEHKDGE